MQIRLDPTDLRPEYQRRSINVLDQAISTRDVTFEKLTHEAQAAVRAAGRGVFYSWDGQTYNAVYPPNA